MANIVKNKAQVVATAQQLIAGAAKHLTGVTQVTLLGSSYTPNDLASKLQSLVNLRSDVDAARAVTAAKVAAEAAQAKPLRALMSAFVAYVRVTFGNSPDVLADFGLAPKAQAQVSPETQVIAAAKRKATRAARHTMGPKQKAGVKGVVADVITIPTSASPVVTTAPASPAAPATSGTAAAAGAVTTAPASPAAPATSGTAAAAGAVTTPRPAS
jgi:hypothetical protein